MEARVSGNTAFRIGHWLVRPDRGCLERDGTSVHLEPKVMDVLVALARRPGAVVTKEELIDEVWAGRPVTDVVITRCISLIRSSLQDSPRDPTYIETLPKRGYRLLPDVVTDPKTLASTPIKATHVRLVVAVLLIAAITTASILLPTKQDSESRQQDLSPSIAVLPFVNMSGPDQQYLCDGISEQLISTLSDISGLAVASRTSSFRFRDSERDIREIGRLLDVSKVVEGSVRRSGSMVRIAAQIVDTETGYHVWSETFDSPVEDTFELQERIATAIGNAIDQDSTISVSQKPRAARPSNFLSYDKFLVARYLLNRRNKKDIERAIQLFSESIELDSNYGPAYLGLAKAFALRPSYFETDATANYDSALETLDIGIKADARIAVAGAGVRGFVHMKRDEWQQAEHQFRIALAEESTEPNNYLWYSQLLATVGRLDDALELALTGLDLDPLSPVANSRAAIANLWLGQNEASRRYYDIANELGMQSPIHTESYALLLVREQRFAELKVLAQQLQRDEPGAIDWLTIFVATLQSGDNPKLALRKVLDAIEDNTISLRVALVALSLLDGFDEAAAILESQDPQDQLEYEVLYIDELAALRQMPAFAAFVSATGLAEYWAESGCRWAGVILDCNLPVDSP